MNPYIVIKPVITEKSLRLANGDNTYTFAVQMTANKRQVKEAIENLFSVEVASIRTVVNQKGNKKTGKRRLAVTTGKTKKAFVTLKEGHAIDLFDISEQQ
ncbi:MAG: 50S ribosomal protein L23 [Patescibacteria group bacterium]|nr:MAG: 50S ribosomal protein L23 [Patescibacteria group bacterium]